MNRNPHAHGGASDNKTAVEPGPAAASHKTATGDWRVVRMLLPYLWEYRTRVVNAVVFLITAKLANIGVPLLMKQIVDALDSKQVVLAVPVTLLVTYGLLRLSSTLFAELRDIVFVRVTQRAMRRVALTVFRHLHAL